MVEMNIKNPNFLKQLPKEARKEAFKWAFYEERILSIKLSFNFFKSISELEIIFKKA